MSLDPLQRRGWTDAELADLKGHDVIQARPGRSARAEGGRTSRHAGGKDLRRSTAELRATMSRFVLACLAALLLAGLLALPAAAQSDPEPGDGINTPLVDLGVVVSGQAATGFAASSNQCSVTSNTPNSETGRAACAADDGARVRWDFTVGDTVSGDHGISTRSAPSGLTWSYAALATISGPLGSAIYVGTYRLQGTCNASGTATLVLRGAGTYTVAVTCRVDDLPDGAITNLAATGSITTDGGLLDFFNVAPNTLRCTAARISGVSDATIRVLDNNNAGTSSSRSLSVTRGTQRGQLVVDVTCDVATHDAAVQRVTISIPEQTVTTSGLNNNPSVSGGTTSYSDAFTTAPAGATCRLVAADAVFTLNAPTLQAPQWMLAAVFTYRGTYTTNVVCEQSGYTSSTDTVTVTVTGLPAEPLDPISIIGLPSTGTTTTGTFTATFTVDPRQASCTDNSASATVTVSQSNPAARILTVTRTVGSGAHSVRITCTRADHAPETDTITVAFNSPSTPTTNSVTWEDTNLRVTGDTNGAAVVTHGYTVSPSTLSCTVRRTSGSASFTQPDTSGDTRSIRVTFTAASSATFQATCGTASQSATITTVAADDPGTGGGGTVNPVNPPTDTNLGNRAQLTLMIGPNSGTSSSNAPDDNIDALCSTADDAGGWNLNGAGAGVTALHTATVQMTGRTPPPTQGCKLGYITLGALPSGCSVVRQSGGTTPNNITLSLGTAVTFTSSGGQGNSRYWPIQVRATGNGSTSYLVTCSGGGAESLSVGLAFHRTDFASADPTVTISGLAASGSTTAATYTDDFNVSPATATCTENSAQATVTGTGGSRTLTVNSNGQASQSVTVTCTQGSNSDSVAVTATFGASITPINPSSHTLSGGTATASTTVTVSPASVRCTVARTSGLNVNPSISPATGSTTRTVTATATSAGTLVYTVTCGSVTAQGTFTFTSGDSVASIPPTTAAVTSGTGTATRDITVGPASVACTVARDSGLLITPSISGTGTTRTVTATSTQAGTLTYTVTCGTATAQGMFTFSATAATNTITIASRGQTVSGPTTISLPFTVSPEVFDCTVVRSGGTLTITPQVTVYTNGGVHQFVTATSATAGTLIVDLTCGDATESATMTWSETDAPTVTLAGFESRTAQITGTFATAADVFTVAPIDTACTVARSGGSLTGITPQVGAHINGGIYPYVSVSSAATGTLEATLTCGTATATATFTFIGPPEGSVTVTGFDSVAARLIEGRGVARSVYTVAPYIDCTAAAIGGTARSTATVLPLAYINGALVPYIEVVNTATGTVVVQLTCGAITRNATFTFQPAVTINYAVSAFLDRRAEVVAGVGRAVSTYSVTPYRGDCITSYRGGTLQSAGTLDSGVTVSSLAYVNGAIVPYVEVVSRMTGTLLVRVTCGTAFAEATFTFTAVGGAAITLEHFAGGTFRIIDGIGRAQSTYTVTPYRGDCTAAATSGSLMGTATVLPLAYINGVIQPYIEVIARSAGSVTVTLTCGAASTSAIFVFTDTAATVTVTGFEDRNAEVIGGVGRAQSTYVVTPYRGDCTTSVTAGSLQSAGTLDSGVTVSSLAHINGAIVPYIEVVTRMIGDLTVRVTCGTAFDEATFTFTAVGGAAVRIENFRGRTVAIVDGVGRAQSTYTVTPYRGDCTAEATSGSLMDSATVLPLAYINGVIQPYIEVISYDIGSVTVTLTCGAATASAIFVFYSDDAFPRITIGGDLTGPVGTQIVAVLRTDPATAAVNCRVQAAANDEGVTPYRVTQPAPAYLPFSGRYAGWHTFGATSLIAGEWLLTVICGDFGNEITSQPTPFTWTADAGFVSIVGFSARSGTAGETVVSTFTTFPADAANECRISVLGLPDEVPVASVAQPTPVYLASGAYAWHTAGARALVAGTATVRLTCGTTTRDAVLTWARSDDPSGGGALVVISGLVAEQSGTLDLNAFPPTTLILSDEFTVVPDDASCTPTGTNLFIAASITDPSDSIGAPTSTSPGARRLQVAFTTHITSALTVTCTADQRADAEMVVTWRSGPAQSNLADPPAPACPAGQVQTLTDRVLSMTNVPCVVTMHERVENLVYYNVDPRDAICTWSVRDTVETRRWSVPDRLRLAYSTAAVSGGARYIRLYAEAAGSWGIRGTCQATTVADDGSQTVTTYAVSALVTAEAQTDPYSTLPSFGGFERNPDISYTWSDLWRRVRDCNLGTTEAARSRFDAAREHYIGVLRTALGELAFGAGEEARRGEVIEYVDLPLSSQRFRFVFDQFSAANKQAVTDAYAEYRQAAKALAESGDGGLGTSALVEIPILRDILAAVVNLATNIPRLAVCVGREFVVPDGHRFVSVLTATMGNRGEGCTGDGAIEACDEGGILLWPIEAIATAQTQRNCDGPHIAVSVAMSYARRIGSTSDLAENQGHLMVTPMDYLMDSDFDGLDGNWFSTCEDTHDGVWAALWRMPGFGPVLNSLVLLVCAYLLYRSVRKLLAVLHSERAPGTPVDDSRSIGPGS